MDKMKIAFILILNCLIIIGTTCFAAVGIVNAPNGLVLRKEAAKGSEPIATISDKTNVEIIEKDGEWYKVKYNEDEGYLYAEYVNVNDEEKTQKNSEESTKTKTSNNSESKTYPQKQKLEQEIKIYSLPIITAKTLANVKKGQEITINYELNGWVNVTYGKTQGWARKYFINGETTNNEQKSEETEKKDAAANLEEKTVENRKGYVDANSSVNVRKDASTSANIIDTLIRNTEVTIIAEKGDFYKIKYDDITGYIAKSLISNKPIETVTSRSNSGERTTTTDSSEQENNSAEEKKSENTTTNSDTTSGSNVVSFAKKYIGYSYVMGGTRPSTGFDCSGFTYYVFNSCGYSLSRSCQVQARSGKAVSRANLQPGDLVFFNNTSDGGIGHVAIYIGGGRIVHAENSRTGVRTDTINSGYYNKYYYSARRIVK